LNFHKPILISLYVSGFSFAVAIAAKGAEYYFLPLQERPHSTLHVMFKPGGVWGHGLGILGSAMMLLLLLYSIRKRKRFWLRFGKIRNWLNIHIFFGIMGPVFITLHTAFKFGGIVSVSYFSMLAVMLSGFVGRYLYVQIPRKLSGDKLSIKEMEEENERLSQILVEKYRIAPQSIALLQALTGDNKSKAPRGLSAIFAILINDFTRPFKTRSFKKQLLKQNENILGGRQLERLINVINKKAALMRKMKFLSSIQPMFHYWHIIHKPFAYVMFIIMFLHIAVAILFGFRWIL